jgi:hypothetical protein
MHHPAVAFFVAGFGAGFAVATIFWAWVRSKVGDHDGDDG